MIEINGKNVADIILDNKNVVKIQDAITLDVMWQKTAPVVVDYFYIENTYSGSNTISITPSLTGSPSSSYYTTTLEYSKDKTNWTTINLVAGTASTISMSQGEKVYFRNDNGKFNYWNTSDRYSITFTCDQNHNAGGNINTLLDYTDPYNATLYQGCFCYLFSNNTNLVSVSSLELPSMNLVSNCYRSLFSGCTSLTGSPTLPATTLGNGCYREMFYDCSSLTTAPALPATSLATECYQNMFYGCSSLTTAPTLPATYCYPNCYRGMFQGCSSLTTAPALPSTALSNYCYYRMFRGCTNLTTPPTLPATTLVSSCYREMFYGCSSLNYINVYANSNSASNCINNWLYGVASSGTFYNYGSASYTYPSSSGIPSGWSDVPTTNDYFYIENTYSGNNTITLTTNGNPSVNSHATSVQYSKDKSTWTTITLSGTNTIQMSSGEKVYFRNDNGYFNTSGFYTSFTCSETHKVGGNIKTLLNYQNLSVSYTSNCFEYLFRDNTKITSASSLVLDSSTHLYCYYGMFLGCTSLTATPVLPATSVDDYCYCSMFNGCTSLVNAPALPANILNDSCYAGMFSGCTSLTTAPDLLATTLDANCYQNMFNGCTSLTTAPSTLPATYASRYCYYRMFNGCTSLVKSPTLQATTLGSYCYYEMFNGCTSLNNVTSYANDISASDCLTNWLNNVSSSGTFHKLGGATYPTGASGIPSGWTIVNS